MIFSVCLRNHVINFNFSVMIFSVCLRNHVINFLSSWVHSQRSENCSQLFTINLSAPIFIKHGKCFFILCYLFFAHLLLCLLFVCHIVCCCPSSLPSISSL